MDIFPTFGPGDSEAQRCETKEKLNLNTRKKIELVLNGRVLVLLRYKESCLLKEL